MVWPVLFGGLVPVEPEIRLGQQQVARHLAVSELAELPSMCVHCTAEPITLSKLSIATTQGYQYLHSHSSANIRNARRVREQHAHVA